MIRELAVTIVLTLTAPATLLPAQSEVPSKERVTYEPSEKVEVISDIVYARYADRTLELDLYLPRNRPRQTIPGIIVIRGGGWRRGDKEGFAFIASRLAQGGFAAASIEYRPSTEAPFPAAVHDVKAATRWMRANAEKFGIDADALGAIGGSAGAHLAVLLATSHGVSELEGEGGNSDASSRIQASVGMATPASFVRSDGWRTAALETFLAVPLDESPETWALASPTSHVDETDPPLLLLHGDSDRVVPYKQSIQLVERYKEAGLTAEMIPIPGAPHGFWHLKTWFGDTMDQAIAFFSAELVSR